MKQFFGRGLLAFLLKLIRVYQRLISPSLPARCRYYPTCSAYAYQALTWQGLGRGGYLAVCRICRCHPWGGSGVDFVPVPLWRYHYTVSRHSWGLVHVCDYDYRARLNVLLQHSLRKSGQKVVRTTSLL